MERRTAARVTQGQLDYVLAHLNDRPRTAVAEAAGVSKATVYRIVREHGGELRHELSTRREGIEATVRKYYPTMTAGEMAARFGYARGRINTWARRLGVRHTPETEARMRRELLARLEENRRRTDHEAGVRKWKRKRRLDELRFLSGQPQQTGFRFARLSTQGRQTVWRLVAKNDYFQSDGLPLTLFYDGQTKRASEDYLARKYGLEFLPAADFDESQGQQENNKAHG